MAGLGGGSRQTTRTARPGGLALPAPVRGGVSAPAQPYQPPPMAAPRPMAQAAPAPVQPSTHTQGPAAPTPAHTVNVNPNYPSGAVGPAMPPPMPLPLPAAPEPMAPDVGQVPAMGGSLNVQAPGPEAAGYAALKAPSALNPNLGKRNPPQMSQALAALRRIF